MAGRGLMAAMPASVTMTLKLRPSSAHVSRRTVPRACMRPSWCRSASVPAQRLGRSRDGCGAPEPRKLHDTVVGLGRRCRGQLRARWATSSAAAGEPTPASRAHPTSAAPRHQCNCLLTHPAGLFVDIGNTISNRELRLGGVRRQSRVGAARRFLEEHGLIKSASSSAAPVRAATAAVARGSTTRLRRRRGLVEMRDYRYRT
jgi:hypothetical protein